MTRRALKRIPVGSSSESSRIDGHKKYRVKIHGSWHEGSFSKQWFGWRFDGYGPSGLQLNLVEQVFEIQSLDPRKRPRKPRA